MTAPPTSTSEEEPREPFGRLVLAEWTKLHSVPRWVLTVGAAVVLTVVVAVLSTSANSMGSAPAGGSEGDEGGGAQDGGGPGGDPSPTGPGPAGENPPPNDPAPSGRQRQPGTLDEYHLVHQTLTGDGSIVARVASQEDSHEWAKAGLMLRQDLGWGAPYAALMVTPDHGVRLQSEFGEIDRSGSDATAPRWLKLTRSGDSVTGYESEDGSDWTEVGTVDLDALPAAVEVGMFVTSPVRTEIERQFGGESVSSAPTRGEASFDHVGVAPEERSGQASTGAAWRDHDRSMLPGLGESSESGGVFTLRGSGDIGRDDFNFFGDDPVVMSLQSALIGMLAVVAVGVLFITSEHKRGMIRTTLTASPRRRRMLTAKAVVVAGVMFVAGLVASVVAFLITQPMLRSNGFGAPDFPEYSLFDASALRAVVGTAALLALVGVLSLAAGSIARRSAPAITVVVLLLLFPLIIQQGLPLSAAKWLTRLTPSAGFAVQQTIERYDTAISPLAGLAVLCAYTAVTFGLALWLLDRRDA